MSDRQAFGDELRRLRQRSGKSLRALGNALAYDPGALSRIEHGHRKPPYSLSRALDRELGGHGVLTGLAAQIHGIPAPPDLVIPENGHPGELDLLVSAELQAWVHMNRRELASLLATLGSLPASAALLGLNSDDLGRLAYAAHRPCDAKAVASIAAMIDATAAQYESFGPNAVLRIRKDQVALIDQMTPTCPEKLRPQLLTHRAALMRALGWMAHDNDQPELAEAFYERALSDAHQGKNRPLAAWILCNKSWLATIRKTHPDPDKGVEDAHAALTWATRSNDKYLAAYAADMAAEAHARAGDTQDCLRELGKSEELTATAGPNETSLLYFYAPGLNASLRSGCLLRVKQGQRAVNAATQAINLVDPEHVLTKSFALINLCNAQRATGEIDGAAETLAKSATIGAKFGSQRLTKEIDSAHRAINQAAPSSDAARKLNTQLLDDYNA